MVAWGPTVDDMANVESPSLELVPNMEDRRWLYTYDIKHHGQSTKVVEF
jgi:hypothetical protein